MLSPSPNTQGLSPGQPTPSPLESPLRSPHPSSAKIFSADFSQLVSDRNSASLSAQVSENSSRTAENTPGGEDSDGSQTAKGTRTEPTGSSYGLTETSITFAVDVSGSTSGPVLAREQAVISKICQLQNGTRLSAESTILPWSHKARSPRAAANVDQLTASGGTDPSVLVNDPESCHVLRNSNVWFLLTDGEIDQPLIRKFANAIPQAGLHGTACVIILFGYARASPFSCNISVGLSVFSVAPHCIFLFHDMKSDILFVLQGKGCFVELLPKEKQFISFGKWTTWDDLVQIRYEDLARVKVPAPASLSQNVVLLPDDREFDMECIYNDTVSEADTLDIISDYQAFDVILGAARTRGREDDVTRWAQNARRKGKSTDVSETERKDTNNAALDTLQSIISDLASQNPATDFKEQPELLWQFLRVPSHATQRTSRSRFLRNAHVNNWRIFESQVQHGSHVSSQMDQALVEVLDTIAEYRNAPISPGAMSMMSSPSPTIASGRSGSRYSERLPRQSPMRGLVLRNTRATNVIDFAANDRAEESAAHDLLFLKGFRARRFLDPTASIQREFERYDTCPVCEEENVIQALLLRRCISNEETSYLPKLNSRAGHKYPMVLGNYLETDVIAPLAVCDACALAFLRAGVLPNGERVDGVLPLVSLREELNRRQWLATLEEVYENRFHSSIVFLVFLSTLSATIEDLQDSDEPSSSGLLKTLEWCCNEICTVVPGISMRTGLTPVTSPLRDVVDPSLPLSWTLANAFGDQGGNNWTLGDAHVLAYPLDGFVCLVRLAELVMKAAAPSIERLVWKRLLYHFLESQARLEGIVGFDSARAKLHGQLYRITQQDSTERSECTQETPPSEPIASISLQSLTASHLVSAADGELETFQRMGDSFAALETTSKYNAALSVFLHLLNKTLEESGVGIKDTGAFFAKLQRRADEVKRKNELFQDLFEDAKLITEPMAVQMLEEVFKLQQDDPIWIPVPNMGSME